MVTINSAFRKRSTERIAVRRLEPVRSAISDNDKGTDATPSALFTVRSRMRLKIRTSDEFSPFDNKYARRCAGRCGKSGCKRSPDVFAEVEAVSCFTCNLAVAIFTYFGLQSKPTNCLPKFRAANKVVPLPQNGSKHRSVFRLKVRINFSHKDTGNIAGVAEPFVFGNQRSEMIRRT